MEYNGTKLLSYVLGNPVSLLGKASWLPGGDDEQPMQSLIEVSGILYLNVTDCIYAFDLN